MSRVYIGIDNGLTGGLVALSDHPGPPIDMITMPTRGKSKGNEVDPQRVMDWIRDIVNGQSVSIILEIPGKWGVKWKSKDGGESQGGNLGLCSAHDSYGALRAVAEIAAGFSGFHRVNPQDWQKVMLPGCAKGDTKPAALAACRRLWPDETWLATARSSTPHTGLIDAALIAEYGRRAGL